MKNIFPISEARSGSLLSHSSKLVLASCQAGDQEALISSMIGRSSSRLLYGETYIARSPSRYPITNSFSRRATSTSLMGLTRGRHRNRHKGMQNRDLPRGL